jgi:hypothetical protein
VRLRIWVSLAIPVGMWLERIRIIWITFSHDFLPSMRRVFLPTLKDALLLFAPFGFFAMLFLILVRFVPAISMHEVRKLRHERLAS